MNRSQILWGHRAALFTRSALELQAGVVTAGHVCLQRNYSTHARSELFDSGLHTASLVARSSGPGYRKSLPIKHLYLSAF